MAKQLLQLFNRHPFVNCHSSKCAAELMRMHLLNIQLLSEFPKPPLNTADLLVLRARLRAVMESDPHAIDGKYQIRSLYFDNLDDASIDYLYRKAMFMVFPTYNEGFGIPIVEAFERRCPVLASDIPVLREVGGKVRE